MPDFEDPRSWVKKPHVVLVVDESGSMNISRSATISAMNDYLQGLKNSLPEETRVSVIKFDSGYNTSNNIFSPKSTFARIEALFNKVALKDVRVITEADYTPTGGTPLLDAIGIAISSLDEVLKAEPAPVYLAILTDGEENSSREYKLEAIKKLITDRQEQGWTITFMGVDINAYDAGFKFGLNSSDIVSINRDRIGDATRVFGSAIRGKYAMSANLAEQGLGLQAYAAWNSKDKTFSDEDKANLES